MQVSEKADRQSMATEWIQGLRVVDLKEELRKRDLSVSGKKAELQQRLTEAVSNEASISCKECMPMKNASPRKSGLCCRISLGFTLNNPRHASSCSRLMNFKFPLL